MARWFRRDGARSDARAPGPSGPSGPARGGSAPALSSLPSGSAGPSPAWSRTATPEEQRFAQVYAADRVGPMPYPHQAVPDIGAARSRVRSLVAELLDGLDEGTGAALDPLIASWTSGWLARVDSEHADHQALVDRLVGGARRQLAEAEAAHERDRRALEIARSDYAEARERLLEPVERAQPARHAQPAERTRPAEQTQPLAGRATPNRSRARGGPGGGGSAGEGNGAPEVGRTAPVRGRRGEPGTAPVRPADPDTGPPEPATGPLPVQRP